MAGMLRCKNEEEFKALLGRISAKVHQPRLVRPLANVDNKPEPPKAPVGRPSKERVASEIEELFASQIRAVRNIPEPVRDEPYLVGRAHRLDFAWPDYTYNGMRIGVEIQGMAHRIKSKFLADIEKRILSQQQGWFVLEFAGEHVRSGKAMDWLQHFFSKAKKVDNNE